MDSIILLFWIMINFKHLYLPNYFKGYSLDLFFKKKWQMKLFSFDQFLKKKFDCWNHSLKSLLHPTCQIVQSCLHWLVLVFVSFSYNGVCFLWFMFNGTLGQCVELPKWSPSSLVTWAYIDHRRWSKRCPP